MPYFYFSLSSILKWLVMSGFLFSILGFRGGGCGDPSTKILVALD
jgi:hypothetical protein